MAYTMSDADNAKIVQYQNAYNAAKAAGDTAAMERAHAGAEAVRNSYGFSGGADGSQQVSIAGNQSAQANPYSSYLDSVKQQPAAAQEKYNQMAQASNQAYSQMLSNVQAQQAAAQQKYNQMAQYSQQSYADMLKSAIAANNAAATQQIARLNSQKSDVNQTYEDNARQAYIAYMQGQQTLPQILAASGLNGGATETANLGLVTNYNTNLGNINNQRANAIKSIDDNIQSAIYQAERDNASTAYSNAGNALNSYLGIMGNAIDSDYNYGNMYNNAYSNGLNSYLGILGNAIDSDYNYNSLYGNAYGRYVDQENYQSDVQREAENLAYQRQQALADQTYDRALQRLQLGMANAQDLAELGLTENDYNTYLMENFGRDINGNYVVPLSGGSSGGGSSGGSGRRSSGRSYGSGGSSSGSGSISDYAPYSDGWYEAIRQAASASGVTPAQYIRTNYKTTLGLGNKDNMEEALKGETAYQEKFKTAQRKVQAEKKAQTKAQSANNSSTGSTNNTKALYQASLQQGSGNKEKTLDVVNALYDKGMLNDNTAVNLVNRLMKNAK